jgi:hypothetical protein
MQSGESFEQRLEALQERINKALRETPAMRRQSSFSEYMPNVAGPLAKRLEATASAGGIEGVESALDEFNRMDMHEDPLELRHALLLFLTHHGALRELGLHVPALGERAPWAVTPSKESNRK